MKKTDVIICGRKRDIKHINIPTIDIGGCENPGCNSAVRNLGVMTDPELSMASHISRLFQSLHYHLRNIGKIRCYLSRSSTEQLIHSWVSCRLDYGNALLYGVPSIQLNRLQKIQNTAARIVTRSSKFSHITPVLRSLHWLPVQSRIEFKILLLTFKALHDDGPQYLEYRELLRTYSPARTLRSASKNLLEIPPTNLKTHGPRSFSVAAATLWNSVPQSIRSIITIETFKSQLKTYLFEKYIGQN